MKKKKSKKKESKIPWLSLLFRFSIILLGIALIYNTTYLVERSPMNAGTYIPMLLGLLGIVVGLWYGKLVALRVSTGHRWAQNLILFSLGVYLIAALSLFLYGNLGLNRKDYSRDVVIVLGAGLRGEQPSLLLKNRLDEALIYYETNGYARFVVTGGQGYGESRTEAQVMKTYLVEGGIPSSRIYVEDQATSTRENFKYSMAILGRERLSFQIAYITNDFHVLRSGILARAQGFDEPLAISAGGVSYETLSNYLRETLALGKDSIGVLLREIGPNVIKDLISLKFVVELME